MLSTCMYKSVEPQFYIYIRLRTCGDDYVICSVINWFYSRSFSLSSSSLFVRPLMTFSGISTGHWTFSDDDLFTLRIILLYNITKNDKGLSELSLLQIQISVIFDMERLLPPKICCISCSFQLRLLAVFNSEKGKLKRAFSCCWVGLMPHGDNLLEKKFKLWFNHLLWCQI